MSHDKKDYTLSDWEEYLAPQVPQVELLGEIPISDEERKQIGRQLGHYLESHWQEGRSSILENIHDRFPATFILFMVAQGIHGWSDSGFWPEVDEVTGHEFDPNWRRKLGRLFERILKKYRLSLFPDMGGYRYVTPILTHGGIPTHSLNDYFKYLLYPAVTRAWYADMSTDELIEDWLLSSYCNIADNSVSHFLESGGEIARDFVERSRELAGEYQETGQVPEAEVVGLPRRVVENFYRWAVEEEGFKPGERREGSGFRFRRPILWLDPWGEGLVLELPPQQIPATHSQAQVEWHIQADGERLAKLPVQIRRSGYDLRTEEKNFRLDKPASEYQVLLWLDDEEKHTWRYPGLTEERPLLVFDAKRQTLLQGQSLPARMLWLLYPAKMELEFDGEAAKREQFPRLPWGWHPFTAEAWDLSQATRLKLPQEGQKTFSIAIRPDEAARRPRLVGGRLYTASNLAATPLYIGQPPTVRVPLVGRSSLEEELSRWRISLRSKWTTQPQRDMVRSLVALLPHLRQTDNDEIELPLNLPDLLGESPIGNFVIRLRGPLGRDAELPLRILPHLEFIGHDELHLPNPETGPPEVTLLFETDSATRLENQAKDENIQIEFEDGLYQVTVGAELDDVTLTAVRSLSEGEPVRVPLWIPLRRLRWTVIGAEKEQIWGGHLLKQPVDALLQTDAPLLLVDLGQGFRPTDAIPDTLTLRLLDVDNTVLQIDEATISPQGRWRFELGRFFDTIRHSDSPVMRFEVSCPYLPGHPEPVKQWVMSLSRLPVVDNVRVVNTQFEVGLTVTISWKERVRLRNQAVRIWSVWRPWQPPHEEKIPNEGEAGTLTFQTNQTDFLIGQYVLEFIVVDPWRQSPEPKRPAKDAPNVAIIETLTPAERINQLNRAIEQFGPSLNMLIERACIQWQQGDRAAFWADVKQGYNHLKEATLFQLLTLADLVDKDGDEQQQTDIRLKLFAPDLFRRLLAQYRRGQLASGLFQRYLGYLPRSDSFPLETSRLLLQLEDERARLYAVQQLLRQNDPLGVETIRQWIQQARLSEADAVALLNDNPLLAVKHLRPYLSEPAMVRILEQLSLDETVIIRPGYWVYSVAGWAQIKEIVDITEERAIKYFLPGQPDLRLRAILRPSYEARSIIITILDNGYRVQFEKQETLYQCKKVEGCCFITPDKDFLCNKHNRASHGGIGPEFKIHQVDKTVFRSTDDLTYRRIAPPDMCG